MKFWNPLFIAAAMGLAVSGYATDTLTVSGINYSAGERAYISATGVSAKEVFDNSYYGTLQIGSNTYTEPFMYCDDLVDPLGSTPVTYQVNLVPVTNEAGWIVDNLISPSMTAQQDAGNQLAIWNLTYPGFTANPSDSGSLADWHNDLVLGAGHTGAATMLVWVSGGHGGPEQSMLIPTPAPEPAPFIGIGMGLVGFAAFRRRRPRA